MKYLVFIVTILLALISCEKSNQDLQVENFTEFQDYLSSGSWKITKFIDSGKDELYHFNSYSFEFEQNGVINASDGMHSYEGLWNISNGNSGDDDSWNDGLEFTIHFSLSNDFEDLNDDWDIVYYSKEKIELKDVSGGNGGIDFLTFTRK